MNYFDFEYRVRYGDTDKMGISYYANYMVWFEAARTEYFRALGMPYTECEAKGYFLPVLESNIRYHSPSTYDDLILIRTSVSEIKKTSVKFEYETFLKGTKKKLATGYTIHVFVNRAMRPTKVPEEVQKAVTLFSLLEK